MREISVRPHAVAKKLISCLAVAPFWKCSRSAFSTSSFIVSLLYADSKGRCEAALLTVSDALSLLSLERVAAISNCRPPSAALARRTSASSRSSGASCFRRASISFRSCLSDSSSVSRILFIMRRIWHSPSAPASGKDAVSVSAKILIDFDIASPYIASQVGWLSGRKRRSPKPYGCCAHGGSNPSPTATNCVSVAGHATSALLSLIDFAIHQTHNQRDAKRRRNRPKGCAASDEERNLFSRVSPGGGGKPS